MIIFILTVRYKFYAKRYVLANVIAVDETRLDMPSSTTVNEAGVWIVTIRSTGHEKDRVLTVYLAAKANGQNLKVIHYLQR